MIFGNMLTYNLFSLFKYKKSTLLFRFKVEKIKIFFLDTTISII
nr:MAG TPA: hypothetical protein [Caudoviricetes sp.]